MQRHSSIASAVPERSSSRPAKPPPACTSILSGGVKLVVEDGDGCALIIGRLGRGEFFGESSILPEGTHAASVEAEHGFELAFLPREALAR